MTSSTTIEIVGPDSVLLEQVITLGDRNSKTLGLLPREVFKDQAKKGFVLAAIDPNGNLIGYLLYRCTRTHAVIVHLCIENKTRRQGIARRLFEEFKLRTQSFQGSRVTCRTDYAANKLWPSLGFRHAGFGMAKKKGKTLQFWWMPNDGASRLFGIMLPQLAVLDSNVVKDMLDSSRADHEEALALNANWLADRFELRVTPELDQEITIDNQGGSRQIEFRTLTGPKGQEGIVLSVLEEVLGKPSSKTDTSDHLQLSHAIRGQAKYFITRDRKLLNKATIIFERFGLTILRGSELISRYDQEIRPLAYIPKALDNSTLQRRAIAANEVSEIAHFFRNVVEGETSTKLKDLLGLSISQPKRYTTEVVLEDLNPLGISVVESVSANIRRILLLRVAPNQKGGIL